jgi:hypothetical protein
MKRKERKQGENERMNKGGRCGLFMFVSLFLVFVWDEIESYTHGPLLPYDSFVAGCANANLYTHGILT